MKTQNADLHCHSVVSDGTLTPAQLALRAKTNGVSLWALTDHDETGGLTDAASAAAAVGLDFLTGVEISVTFLRQTIHIVGLGFDADNATLKAGLLQTRSGRLRRARQMADDLAHVGIAGAFEGALHYAGNPDLVSRTHFARFLVDTGVCRDTGEVFRKYLNDGKPGYVAHQWATLQNAVGWITRAGGVAVLAHPARYRFDSNQEWALLADFKGHGGQAIEVITGSHSVDECKTYAQTAIEFGLAASRGSDFHSPDESHTDLGILPPLPGTLTPVWTLLADRIVQSSSSC